MDSALSESGFVRTALGESGVHFETDNAPLTGGR